MKKYKQAQKYGNPLQAKIGQKLGTTKGGHVWKPKTIAAILSVGGQNFVSVEFAANILGVESHAVHALVNEGAIGWMYAMMPSHNFGVWIQDTKVILVNQEDVLHLTHLDDKEHLREPAST